MYWLVQDEAKFNNMKMFVQALKYALKMVKNEQKSMKDFSHYFWG
jgi:hypothetical protein